MALNIHDRSFSSAFGLLGNILSFLVYLAPLPTFYRIFKKKSTEGFQSIPYSVALFSAMLLLYYAFLKKHDASMLITINSIGCCIESIYLFLYMIYATKSDRIYTTKLLVFFNIGALGLIILVTLASFHGPLRVSIVGWICAIFSVCVFAAPLSIIRSVLKTKSVEYMPFPLSFFLTLCAITWFLYGFSLRDFYIATPNILGFSFGVTQMILYVLYRGGTKESVQPESGGKLQLERFPSTGDQQSALNQAQEAAVNYGVGGTISSNSQIVPSELNV
ncbi:Bidirectional sugar transporter SWEET13 [Hibiscus syriacus]|uniref:Bidirectional sugar transporter SWEET n=1 Tax=Hibiscus syriacus TaxID=106335 RepID=A0A6A2XML2_HIBSY|nr:bidirectional sugar transporter SWEET14-like [Hibiscus syriacus]KAE8676742.1 Bidirectional sugar transporter SWEET13 [Hibiscus syriacus]